jgi:hypothetical protein
LVSSLLDVRPVGVEGCQSPRVLAVPGHVASSGVEAVELAAHAGLVLDPWQALVLEHGLGERAGDGNWAAFEVAVVVPRQNGKGSVLEARELAGLFLLGEQLILHSAHELKTAMEAFRRVLALVQNTPDLDAQVKRVTRAHGEEGIELRSGQRLRFVARSTGSGRGFTGDCVILDEAYNLDDRAMSALLPTLSARPNPQLWYASSAGMLDSAQLAAVRARGLSDDPGALAYFEWSVPDGADPDDPACWAQANPALGRRITSEFVARERAAMPDVAFARERLGVWETRSEGGVLDPAAWALLADPGSQIVGPVFAALDVTPDRQAGAIAVAGVREDGLGHREVAAAGAGTDWMVRRAAGMVARHQVVTVAVDPGGPAGSLIPGLQAAGVPLLLVSGREYAQACGALFDEVGAASMRHLGQPGLDAAVGGAKKRPIGEAWGWARRSPDVDISPLVAVTLAAWAQGAASAPKPVFVW